MKTNYDHPFAFDNKLLTQHLKNLLDNKSIEKPIYDFEIHNRKKETITVEPKDIIILEGGYNKVAIDILVTKIKSILEN